MKDKEYQRQYYQKTKEWRKEYGRNWRAENREKALAYQKQWYREQREKWYSILEEHGLTSCNRCGYSSCFAAIEYHHDCKDKKEITIGHELNKKPTEERIQKVLLELAKCTPLCANCHREIHFMEDVIYAEC